MRRPYAADTPREFTIQRVVVSDELEEDEVTAKYSFAPEALSSSFPPEAISKIRRRSDPNAITLRSVGVGTDINQRRRNERDAIVVAVSVLISLTLGGLTAAALAVIFCAAIGVARWWLVRRFW